MRIETVVRGNGLYSLRAIETLTDTEGKIVSKVIYTAVQVYDFTSGKILVEFATSEFAKDVPEDVKKKLAEVLEYISKEF